MNEIDQLTIRQAVRGDEKAFRRVYDHYSPFLWKVIFRTVNGEREAASEILQDSFIRMWKGMRGFSSQSAFSTWACSIAYNAARTYLTKRKVRWERGGELTEEAGGRTGPDRTEQRDAVERILAGLTPDERFLLTSTAVTGLGFDELSAATGVAAGALRTRLHRIRERVRKEFGDEYHE